MPGLDLQHDRPKPPRQVEQGRILQRQAAALGGVHYVRAAGGYLCYHPQGYHSILKWVDMLVLDNNLTPLFTDFSPEKQPVFAFIAGNLV